MFLFRSLFWLSAAFLVIAPQADVAETARSAPWAAFNATQSAVAQYAPHIRCDSFECVAGRAILSSAAGPALSVQEEAAAVSAPATAREPGADALAALILAQQTGPTQTAAALAPSPIRRPAALL